RPGQVVDTTGRVLGHHRGAYRYTVGQRRGLGIAAATPRYVLRVEPAAGRVVVGERADLAIGTVHLEGVTTTDGRPLRPGRAKVRLRAHGAEVGCRVIPLDDAGPGDPRGHAPTARVRLDLDEPVDAVAPGQAGVLYDDDLVLGGGTVAATGTADTSTTTSGPGSGIRITDGGAPGGTRITGGS
ncbi:MAG TPA: tRNA methyl transferase PRC-barrel domain-containing protein, partial [Actinomycetota bacterium]